MAPKSKSSKREAILDAILDIVVERGFHDAPMSQIVQRSGASAGIIYHYFSSKEEIIRALYQRIRALKSEAFLAGFDPDQDPGKVFVQIFISLYAFYRKHPREMRFYEQYESAGFACTPDHAERDEREAAFAKRFSSKSRGGVLKEWPTDVLEEATLGTVRRLAVALKPIPKSLLRENAESMWEMVRA